MSTPKPKELFLATSLRDGLEDNNIKQVTTLLQIKEADPNVLLPMHGITPFHLVIGNESETFAEEVTKLFLRHGGNPNVKSVDGMTPVHVAAAWGRVNVLELLLDNGGDPLSLDDEGRSPFHYAFDGSYYEAITVLGKYCTKRQEEEDEDNCDGVNEPKIEIKLEKILINRGDVIAEYVPSEIDLTDTSLSSSTIENTKGGTVTSDTQETTSPENHRDFQRNITLRRHQICKNKRIISPILPQRALDIEIKERSAAEEKILIGEIINRLSDSFNKAEKDDLNLREKENMKNNKKKKFCSLLPQPKYFKSDLETPKKKEKIFPSYLDNSIISTSPNFRVVNLKREDTPPTPRHSANLKCNFTPKKFATPSVKTSGVTPKIKSASSTPKRKAFASKITQIRKNNEKTPMNRTYKKKDILPLSPEIENNLKSVNRRLLSSEFARKLEKSYDDDIDNKIENSDEKNYPKKCNIELSTLNNLSVKKNVDGNMKNKICNSPSKKLAVSKRIQSPVTPECVKKAGAKENTEFNIPHKSEKKNFFFESPGSSNPRSFISSPKRDSTGEELKLWSEIDKIYEEKGKTPLASVSGMDNDSLETLEESNWVDSSMMTEATFFSDIGNHAENSRDDVTKESESLDIFQTPSRSTISSRCSIESFFSVDEEYAYVDSEKNVAFLERRLLVMPPSQVEDMNNVKNESTWMDMLERLSLSSTSSVPSSVGGLTNLCHDHHSLRYRLIALGEAPGPITDTTFNVYLKRLRKLERNVKLNEELSAPPSRESVERVIKCSSTIPKVLLSTDWITNLQKYRDIEQHIFKEYERPSAKRNYRGGVARVSFNYLLLDPRITNDLPRTGNSLSLLERWKIFLEAIFYIGKGKSARPAAHLYEAFDLWTGKKKCNNPNDKLKKIMKIWRSGKGVVSLQVFSNSMQEEAFNREAAMIDALGTSNLSNCCRGQYYGIITTMGIEEKRSLGKFLLYKSMEILMHEGERQLFPKNVE